MRACWLPQVAAGSAAQELLYRGTLLTGLTYFISDNLRAVRAPPYATNDGIRQSCHSES